MILAGAAQSNEVETTADPRAAVDKSSRVTEDLRRDR
jgi:hypothetical protein